MWPSHRSLRTGRAAREKRIIPFPSAFSSLNTFLFPLPIYLFFKHSPTSPKASKKKKDINSFLTDRCETQKILYKQTNKYEESEESKHKKRLLNALRGWQEGISLTPLSPSLKSAKRTERDSPVSIYCIMHKLCYPGRRADLDMLWQAVKVPANRRFLSSLTKWGQPTRAPNEASAELRPQSASLCTRSTGTKQGWNSLALAAALEQWMWTSTPPNSHCCCFKSEIKWAVASLSLWPSKDLNSLRCCLTPHIFGGRDHSLISFLGFLPRYTLKTES